MLVGLSSLVDLLHGCCIMRAVSSHGRCNAKKPPAGYGIVPEDVFGSVAGAVVNTVD